MEHGIKGKKHSPETIRKIKEARKKQFGEKSANWKGGITPINERIRKSKKYKLWRKEVFERDNYACIWCGFKGNLHADHIKSFALFPKLRLEVDNGRTLCIVCHKKTDTYGNKRKDIPMKTNNRLLKLMKLLPEGVTTI